MTAVRSGEQPGDRTADIGALCDHALALAARMPGPLRHVAVRLGDAAVEVDWDVRPAGAGPETAAPESGSRLLHLHDGGSAAPAGPPPAVPDDDAQEIRSPLVGTFHRAPFPDAEPFVTVGSVVAAGQTVGIVEAMKLFNPICCDVEGRVTEILVTNGESVEFDQVLVRVVPVGLDAKAV